MSIEVEVNMKIPTLTIKSVTNEPNKRIDNSLVRFTKVIQVPAIAKPGAALQLTTRTGESFECTVTRTEWNDERDRFILSCSYSKKSISPDLYAAIVSDEEWKQKQL